MQTGILIFATLTTVGTLLLSAAVIGLSMRIRKLESRLLKLERMESIQEVNEDHIERLEALEEKKKRGHNFRSGHYG